MGRIMERKIKVSLDREKMKGLLAVSPRKKMQLHVKTYRSWVLWKFTRLSSTSDSLVTSTHHGPFQALYSTPASTLRHQHPDPLPFVPVCIL